MNDFQVFLICHNFFMGRQIKNFFEEEENLVISSTSDNGTSEWLNITGVASADLVILLERKSDDLVIRLCNRWNVPYIKVDDISDAKEKIAEKFLEWSEGNGT